MSEPNSSEQAAFTAINLSDPESLKKEFHDLQSKYNKLSEFCETVKYNEMELTSQIELLKEQNNSLVQQCSFASAEHELIQNDIVRHFNQTSLYIKISSQYQALFTKLIRLANLKNQKFSSDMIKEEKKKSSEINTNSTSSSILNKRSDSLIDFNKSLNEIEKAISSEGSSNKLLLDKANILIRKSKFHKARQILREIINDKHDQRSSSAARELLSELQILQKDSQESNAIALLNDLKKIAKKYNHQIRELSTSISDISQQDIPSLVRQEARRARKAELPMLSYKLIEKSLEADQTSPWLIIGKALSLNMMGERSKALSILRELKDSATGEKVQTSITKHIKDIKSDTKSPLSKKFFYLYHQVNAVAKNVGYDMRFVIEDESIIRCNEIKSLIYKEAITCFKNNPDISLMLVDTILDYFPNDGASLQLRGKALSSLRRFDEAIQTWIKLVHSDDKSISQTACDLISECLGQEAILISANESKEAAILFYIKQHLKHNITPVMNNEIRKVLQNPNPSPDDISDPALHKYESQLMFDTLLVKSLEASLM